MWLRSGSAPKGEADGCSQAHRREVGLMQLEALRSECVWLSLMVGRGLL